MIFCDTLSVVSNQDLIWTEESVLIITVRCPDFIQIFYADHCY